MKPFHERVTTRGWIVFGSLILITMIGLTWAWGDRMVVCDWRGQLEPCKIIHFEDVVEGWDK